MLQPLNHLHYNTSPQPNLDTNNLQKNHSGTRQHTHSNKHHQLTQPKRSSVAHVTRHTSRATLRTTATGVTSARTSSSRQRHGTRTSCAHSLEQGRASTSRRSSRGSSSRASKVTSGSTVTLLLLLLVVGVQGPVEHLLGRAHAVGAVLARGGVTGDALAHAVAADGAVQVGVLLARHAVLHHAREGLFHAGAEFRVGRRGQCAGGFPARADGRARPGDGVGGRVAGAVGAGGADAVDFLRVRGEAGQGADGAVGDGDQTWMELAMYMS